MPNIASVLDKVYQPVDRCPVCSVAFNKVNHKALCIHVFWKPGKRGGWRLKNHYRGKSSSAQAQKYNIVPAWRTERRGHKGEMK